MDKLKRHLPFSGEEGQPELKKIAVRLEEKIHTVATSQPRYLRKISQKMLTMETKSKNTITNSLPSNSGSNSENPPDTVNLMDTNNWRPAPSGGCGGEPTMDAGDWRTQLQPDSRRRIVNKIMDTLKRNLPFSGVQGLPELKRNAVRFEEKIYTVATSQPDYLTKICQKMLIMATKSQNTMTNSLPSNCGSNSENPPDTVNLMDTNNWRPAPGGGGGGEPTMDAGDWRTQLQPDSRRGIVNKIMDTLKRNLPFSGVQGLPELKRNAVRFEEKIYTVATSQPDYLTKICQKMLIMATKSQNTMTNSLPSNCGSNSENPPDTVNLMDTNNWRPAPGGGGGGEPTMDAGDWRTQLQPDSRRGIVNKIMDTLKRNLPFSGVQGLPELKRNAVRFEEKIYTVATSQPDYLTKICQKMLIMATKSQNTMTNSLPSNCGSNSENPPDTVNLMDTNNWRPAPGGGGGGEPTMDAGDWRTQLQPDSRRGIVNKIMDTLKRHLPFSGVEGLPELKRNAVRFEEKIYTVATSQPDYVTKICQKMLIMATKSQNTMTNSLPSNSGSKSENPPDTGE